MAWHDVPLVPDVIRVIAGMLDPVSRGMLALTSPANHARVQEWCEGQCLCAHRLLANTVVSFGRHASAAQVQWSMDQQARECLATALHYLPSAVARWRATPHTQAHLLPGRGWLKRVVDASEWWDEGDVWHCNAEMLRAISMNHAFITLQAHVGVARHAGATLTMEQLEDAMRNPTCTWAKEHAALLEGVFNAGRFALLPDMRRWMSVQVGHDALAAMARSGHLDMMKWGWKEASRIQPRESQSYQHFMLHACMEYGRLAFIQWVHATSPTLLLDQDVRFDRAVEHGHVALIRWCVEHPAALRIHRPWVHISTLLRHCGRTVTLDTLKTMQSQRWVSLYDDVGLLTAMHVRRIDVAEWLYTTMEAANAADNVTRITVPSLMQLPRSLLPRLRTQPFYAAGYERWGDEAQTVEELDWMQRHPPRDKPIL